jgi:hypothetical protein
MTKDSIFLKNYRTGIISIVAMSILVFLFFILTLNSIGITEYLFIISGILMNIFITGQILYRYLVMNKNIKYVTLVSLFIFRI